MALKTTNSSSKVSVFSDGVSEAHIPATTLFKQSLNVDMSDPQNPTVSFYTKRGKGSGTAIFPAAEMGNFLEALMELRNAKPTEETEDKYVPPAEMVRRSGIRLPETVTEKGETLAPRFQFRAAWGKGSKPCTVNVDEMDDLISLIRDTIPQVNAAIERKRAGKK